jgi:adenosyl cobinamide kinase/adenosyl cobinamide phosphate guanylyltransferase
MLDAFKKLVENGMISEDLQSEIETAFNQRIQENRDLVTAELREEFAQRYSHDKTVMVEALDKMISERLTAEMAELAEDKNALIESKVAYQRKMTQDAKVLESFIMNQLGKELVEFQSDRRKVSENFEKLEQFIVTALAREINEFAIDKRDLAETKVKLVREAKSQFDSLKKQFVQRSAAIVKETVETKLKSEMRQLKEDIDSARQNAFGRRLYEAFAQEFSTSYLNEKSETAKLLKIIEKKDVELAEAKSVVTEKAKLVESKDREIRVAQDVAKRKEVMAELLAPLGAEQKGIMKELLESVQTAKLNESFDKYLPAVMEGNIKKVTKAPAKEMINESAEITGDRENKQPQVGLDNILDIRKLAGLK